MGYLKSGLIAMSVCAMVASVAFAEERDPTISRVPGDQRADAKAMKNPIAKTPENIAKGKAFVERKGRRSVWSACPSCLRASRSVKGERPAALPCCESSRRGAPSRQPAGQPGFQGDG